MMKDRTKLTSLRRRAAVALVAAALAACSADEPGGRHEVARGAAALDETVASPTEPAPRLSASTPDSRSDEETSRPPAALRDVPFRVLLLPEPYAQEAVITSGPVWYAMSYDDERNVNVAIHATNNVHMELPDDAELPEPNARVRGIEARSSVNEGIRSLTWEEDGAAYVIEIECWDVLRDPRCTEPGFAQQIADGLVEMAR